MHERFQELCAAASIGQAGPEDLALLEQHLAKCELCRRSYSEFTDIAAQEHALAFDESLISPDEAHRLPDAELLRQRFSQRTTEPGFILTSSAAHVDTPPLPSAFQFPLDIGNLAKWKQSLYVLAAVFVVALSVLSGYKIGRRSAAVESSVRTATVNTDSTKTVAASIAELTDLNVTLEQEVADLKRNLERARTKSRDTQEALGLVSEEKKILSDQHREQDGMIERLQKKLDETETLLDASKQETARLQAALGDAQTSYVANQVRIREVAYQLSEKAADLNREEQLLQQDRDIRELMVARNLHIFDVFDTDTKGKTSPAFGRIFYTEGKSLLFYAYDLNEINVRNAGYHYRVWGGKEGQDDKATSLGIFYSDDKAQRRWVFKCNDPRVLRQIDSVFVTLESSSVNPSHPKGQKLLDAYLRGLPNHP